MTGEGGAPPSPEIPALGDASRHAEKLRLANEQLRKVMEALAGEKKRRTARNGATTEPALGSDERERLRHQLADIERQNDQVAANLTSLDQYITQLANLYVAVSRLSDSLDEKEVLNALEEILVSMVGTEDLAIFVRSADERSLVRVVGIGIGIDGADTVPLDRGAIGQAGAEGRTLFGKGGKDDPIACVPLLLDGKLQGAVVIFALLPQKSGISERDRELLDLLSDRAARSLYCAALHARKKQ
jgi:nitrate/nitrite-specific signal transduction histidine kinase